jgi:alanine dehydrogenase
MLVLSHTDVDPLVDDAARAELHRRLRDGISRQGVTTDTVAPNPLHNPTSSANYVPLLGVDATADRATGKVLVDNPDNRARKLPAQVSAVTLVDATTGQLLAVLHGGALTRLRTAVTSAVATEALSSPSAHRLGLIGAGGLALEHLRAIRAIRPVDTVTVWSRSEQTTQRFVDEVRALWDAAELEVVVAADPREVVEASDIVCTLTPSTEPVLHGEWLRPGQHLNVVGAPPRGDHREVDGEALRRSTLFVDHEATVRGESGDYLLARDIDGVDAPIAAELGGVLRGDHPGRTGDDEITLYDSVGTGLQDTVAAQLFLDLARERGAGTEVDF